MNVAIMQPTFLPWLGYFDLMDQVDCFVLLDNVEISPRSWQQRNRIKGRDGLQWLTVPIRASRGQRIDTVELADTRFIVKHQRTLENVYAKAPHFRDYAPPLFKRLESGVQSGYLVRLNCGLIEWLARELQITTPMIKASSLRAQGRRGELLAAICEELSATSYLSPEGSRQYLEQDGAAFSSRGIAVEFQAYGPVEYSQRFPPFAPFASAVDALFNEGPEARAIMTRGRQPSRAPDSLPAVLSATQ